MQKARPNPVKAIKQMLAMVGEKDTTTYTLHRSTEGRVWVSTWEAGDKGYGGFGGTYSPKEFDRVKIEGKSLQVLVEEAIREVDRTAARSEGRARIRRRNP